MGIFLPLSSFHLCHYCASFPRCKCCIGWHQDVRACDVPDQHSTTFPGDNGCSIWAFVIWSVDVRWFYVSGNLCCFQWPPDNIVHSMWVAALAETTAKAMGALVIHFHFTMDASVRTTERQIEASLSSCRPREVTGRALSHAPDSLVATASRWAQAVGPLEDSKRVYWRASTLGASQAHWRWLAGGYVELNIEDPCCIRPWMKASEHVPGINERTSKSSIFVSVFIFFIFFACCN